MATMPTQPARQLDNERLRRRRDRHAALAADRALTEFALRRRARNRRDRGLGSAPERIRTLTFAPPER